MRSRRLTRLTAGLAAFTLANSLLVEIGLSCAPGPPPVLTTLDYTRGFLRGVANDDSWKPMRAALAHLDAPEAAPLYRTLFFEHGVKFQYPPTSLLPLSALRAALGPDAISNRALNALAYLAAVATVGLVALLLVSASRASPATAAAGSLDASVRAACAVVLSVTFYPFLRGSILGQLQTWVDLLFAALVLAWMSGRPALAGCLAGLACALKPAPLLLGLWGLARGHTRFTLALAATLGLLGAAAGWLYGFGNYLDYLRLLAYMGARGESFQPNQSLNGLVNRLFGNGDALVWQPAQLAPYHVFVHALTLAGGLAFAWLALGYRRRDARGAELEDLMLAGLAATIAAPIAWEHHYGIALPIFAVALPRALATPGRGAGGATGLALAYLLMSHHVEALDALAGGPASPLGSYLLAGGLVLLVLLLRLRRSRHAAQGSAAPA